MPRRLILCLWLILACLPLAGAGSAWAHSSSNAYLDIAASGRTLDVQWSIALRDLDYAIGLDADGSGTVTWGTLRGRAAAISAYVLPRLTLLADGAACVPGKVEMFADRLSDGGYAVLRFQAACPAAPAKLEVRYALLFDLDPQHRGLLSVNLDGSVHAAALSPAQPAATFSGSPSPWAAFLTFFKAGAAHLLTGADHLLFIVMLLVPAMLRRRTDGARDWEAAPRFGPAFLDAVKLLSAFTVAHAITLASAVLGYVSLPAQAVDAAIAVTILLTALDNIWHVLPGPRLALGFGFGLIHGFGYASTLGPMHLPPAALAMALLAFNLGLEAGQIGIAALLLPGGFWVRRTAIYRRRVMPGLSGLAALVALAWIASRAGGWGVMPF